MNYISSLAETDAVLEKLCTFTRIKVWVLWDCGWVAFVMWPTE